MCYFTPEVILNTQRVVAETKKISNTNTVETVYWVDVCPR